MTTWYMDYEAGTDSNASAGNGDSFATRRKKIDNFVAAAIAPGDTIRIMASPDPTSVGDATWTGVSTVGGGMPATVAISSSTNATPIVVTTSAVHGLAAGDTVQVLTHSTNTNANGTWKVGTVPTTTTFQLLQADGTNSVGNGVGGATGTVRKVTPGIVHLATACTKNIAVTGNRNTKTAWTASANVTCYGDNTYQTNHKEGGGMVAIDIAAGFTTGLAAYFATGTLDLSGYQQVSFWVKQTAGTIGAAGANRFRLCTDTAGATPVHDIPIPALGALNQWVPVVVDLATNLNAAIQSINFDVVTDNGAQTFFIDNVIACKAASSADSLNLTSLISKNSGSEAWFGIQSINDNRIVLDGPVTTSPFNQRGYSGTTETVTTYKRETIKTVAAATNGTNVQTFKDSGTAGNLIAYSGGWNRTDMSTQTGETWFDGQNGFGRGISDANNVFPYNSFDKLNFTRYGNAFICNSATDLYIGTSSACCTSDSAGPYSFSGGRLTATTLSAVCCGGPISPGTAAVVTTIARADSTTSGNGVTLGAGSWTGTITQANNNTGSTGVQAGECGYIGSLYVSGNSTAGYTPSNRSVAGYVVATNHASRGVVASSVNNWVILAGYTSGNGGQGVYLTQGYGTLRNFTINESTEVSGFTAYNDARVYSENHDGTANNVQIFCDGGLISKQSSVVHGSASHAWKFSPTSTNRSQYYPLNLPIAQIAVAASALVTVKAWFRRSNTGLTGKLVCKGGQLSGVASDVSSSITAIADTWEQLTITFTSSEAGVIEVEAQFYGGTTYSGYVSDMEITQA